MSSCSKIYYYLSFLSTLLSASYASCPAAIVSNLASITNGILFVGEFNTVSPQARELCVSLSHSLPLLLFLCITKWLTFMTDTTIAKRAEIFILILMKTGIFERKNAFIVAVFNETVARGWVHRCISSVFWFSIALVILLFLL